MRNKINLISLFILFAINCYGQVNCDAVYEKDTPCYQACKMDEQGFYDSRLRQGSRVSQIHCDSIIALCPTFAEGYYTKSIPYLKRGEFLKWKPLIDKAVECDTVKYIGYRGGARFMFLRDYKGAIADIELLKTKLKKIGSIYSGDYHLNCILALSYRGIGDTLKAIEILKQHVLSDNRGFYDLYHLGVMFFQTGQLNEAKKTLEQQISVYPFADLYYYIAQIHKRLSNKQEFMENIKKALECYENEIVLPGRRSYMDYPDKVYLKQISDEFISFL